MTPARQPGHRTALVGVRKLRHPVQGVRHARHAAHHRGEDRRRRDGAPVHRAWPRPSRCTSRGTGSTTTPRSARYAAEHGVRAGHHQLQHLPGRRLQVRQPDPHRQDGAAEGDRPPPGLHRDHEPDRFARSQDLAGRRHQLPRPGRHPRPAGPAGRIAGHHLPAHRRRPANGVGVQVLRARDVHDRRAGLGHLLRAGLAPSASARRCASTPATTRPAPTSSSSSRSCCGWGSWARSTSTRGSTPTTTSSSGRPTRSSCSASCSR